METENNKWSSAALNGLLLSVITIIFSLLTSILEPKAFVALIFWAIKLIGSIYLLYYFMNQYSARFETISYGQSFNYGAILCIFSSIICSCFIFFSLSVIFPSQTEILIESLQRAMAAQNLNSDQETVFEKWMERLPEVMLFFNLAYYSLFGVIASSIIANYTKKTNPFADKQE